MKLELLVFQGLLSLFCDILMQASVPWKCRWVNKVNQSTPVNHDFNTKPDLFPGFMLLVFHTRMNVYLNKTNTTTAQFWQLCLVSPLSHWPLLKDWNRTGCSPIKSETPWKKAIPGTVPYVSNYIQWNGKTLSADTAYLTSMDTFKRLSAGNDSAF